MLFFRPFSKIRVVYKSGYVHDFDALSFDVTANRYNWTAADPYHRPIKLGADDVAAVWQIGISYKFDITYMGQPSK